MIDSVLKGTGNSRFLKSAVPAGTSWADALAMLQAGTFPIDFNGINTDGFQQVGTPLNKANLLKDATAAQIGLPPSTTPDGMFQALGNTGELHVWRKTVIYNQPVPEVPGSYTLGAARQYTAGRRNTSTSASSYIYKLSVSNEISVDLDGNVTLVNPTTVSLCVTRPASFESDFARTALGGYCYFMATDDTIGEACDMYLPRGQILYVAENAVYKYAIKEYDSMSSFDAAQPVTGVPGSPAIPAGITTTYPVSTNPNAYQEGDDAKPAGYTLGEVVTGLFKMGPTNSSTGYYYGIANSITVNDGGTIPDLTNTFKVSKNISSSDLKSTIAGKFVQLLSYEGTGNSGPGAYPFKTIPGPIVFIPADVNCGISEYSHYIDRYQPVTGYAAIPAGNTIEYLGKLGDKARVRVLSYVGTGTYGASNPCSITADFKIKVALLVAAYHHGGANGVSSGNNVVMAGDVLTTSYQQYMGAGNSSDCYAKKSSDGKTFFWYQTSSINQYNYSGAKYWILAIG